MDSKGKIAVIIPEISDTLDFEMLQGIYSQAEILGYDIIVLTGVFNSQGEFQNHNYIKGQKNIFEIASLVAFDGILYAAERFKNPQLRKYINEILLKTSAPCLVLEEKNDYFPYIFAPQKESIKKITEHLIYKHGYKNIYCLTGPKDNFEAMERLSGFYEALQEADLPYDDNVVFYGDFWRNQPYELGLKIARGEIKKPDAIVCASDVMAMALCDALMDNGISVPDDIAITGYDGSIYSFVHTPNITTISGRDFHLGQISLCRLHEMITKKRCDLPNDNQYFLFGTSCGCSDTENDSTQISMNLLLHLRTIMYQQLDRKSFLTSNFIAKLSDVDDYQQLISTMDELSNLLPNWKQLDVCLCEDWKFSFDNPEEYRQKGFSDKMLLAISKKSHQDEVNQYTFPLKTLLPSLSRPHEPLFIVCTSLHSGSQIFGYIATAYDNAKMFYLDEHYINWCDAVSNGLQNLQKNMYATYMKQQVETMTTYDFETGMYNRQGLLNQIPEIVKWIDLKKETCALVMLSYKQGIGILDSYGLNNSLIIANALRLSCHSDEIVSRYDDKTFLVLLGIYGEVDQTEYMEQWILQFEQILRNIKKQTTSSTKTTELVSDYTFIINKDVNEIAAMINKSIKLFLDKTRTENRTMTDYKEHLNHLRREMRLSPQNNWNIPDLSDKLGLSGSHFQRLYREQFSVSCMEDIIRMRIDKAKQLLKSTTLHIHEIAEHCGYQNTNHFIRQFKSREDISPLQYRKNYSNTNTNQNE